MMPVIRVSKSTFERLAANARPFEDKPEDVIIMALNALDEKRGRKPPVAAPQKPASTGKKLPQREFRMPLIEVLNHLGGAAHVSEIRPAMEAKMAPRLSDADFEPVSSGDPRWWNAVCWERANLVREGLFEGESDRGVWELTLKGKAALR